LYDEDKVARVVNAWRLMREGKVVKNDVPGKTKDPLMVQECNSFVEGLPVQLFWDNSEFEWCQALEESWESVRNELLGVLGDEAKLSQGSNVWVGPLAGDDVAKAYGEKWKTLGLFDRAEWDEANLALFPVTSGLLARSGVPLVEALFARMAPASAIKAHSDMSNFVLTAHLGVDVPELELEENGKGESTCWIQVGAERRKWENGKVLVFDTSVLHKAANEHPSKDRHVLMLRVWHPQTSSAEREALQFIFDACADPDLVATDEQIFLYPQLAKGRADYFAEQLSNS